MILFFIGNFLSPVLFFCRNNLYDLSMGRLLGKKANTRKFLVFKLDSLLMTSVAYFASFSSQETFDFMMRTFISKLIFQKTINFNKINVQFISFKELLQFFQN